MSLNSHYRPKPVPTKKRDSFAAVVVEDPRSGKKNLEFAARPYYDHAVNKMKIGDKVTVILEQQKWKRTVAQSSYYWGVYLPLIAAETGEGNLDRLHTLFKGKFLTTGIYDVLGEKVRVTKSTTDLSVGEFCEYILNIQDETGIEAPPTENYSMVSLQAGTEKLRTGGSRHDKQEVVV